MDLTDRTVIVTGGASGIGHALARRFVAEGARGVVIADVDADGARAGAAQIGERALGVTCDASDCEDVRRLIRDAQEAFGPVDLFCANAGVAQGAGLNASDDAWDLAWSVNVRGH